MRSITTIVTALVLTCVNLAAQIQDASQVLAEMRQALGGAAALDAIRTLTARGEERRGPMPRSLPFELFVLLPDHYMTIARDFQHGGPMPVEITYYKGVRGNELIRRVDSNIPFPPDPIPSTPQAAAQHQRRLTLSQQHEFARLALLFLGSSVDAYPLQFTYAGRESVDSKACDVVEARHVDGFTMRLFVDAATRLPAMISWQAPPVITLTTTSTSIVATGPRGTQVTTETPAALPPVDLTPGAPVEHRLLVSDFKIERGLNWPRRLRYLSGKDLIEELRFRSFSINPKIDVRRFDIR